MAHKGARMQSQLERDHRLAEVAPLYLSGQTQQQIAERVGVSQQQISKDIRTLRQRWQKAALMDTDRRIGEQDATYQQLIAAHLPLALSGKTRSAEVVITALEKQSRLLGLDQPTRQQIEQTTTTLVQIIGDDADEGA